VAEAIVTQRLEMLDAGDRTLNGDGQVLE
jgi:hypothetical protein